MRGRMMSWILAGAIVAAPAAAQVRTVDPNAAGSLAASAPVYSQAQTPPPVTDTPPPPAVESDATQAVATQGNEDFVQPEGTRAPPAASESERAARDAAANNAYQDNDVLAAAEGVFGKGAEGLAKLIEKILKDQGHPNAYIAGREVGGAVIVGLRYGSGTLFHKIEGQRPVYWTGPSIGFDLGANGAKTFVLVYNLYDTEDLFRRYPAAEGDVYVVGGFTASYLRRGDVVLIPIRLGVGWRLGANIGYMKFTKKSKWLPF